MFQKRDCVKNWNMTLTMYGYCLQLIPSSTVYSQSIEGTTLLLHDIILSRAKYWRRRTNCFSVDCIRFQQVRLGFNRLGKLSWRVKFEVSNTFLTIASSFTLYYTAVDDEALEPAKSILLTDVTRGVPIVSLRQKKTKLLGRVLLPVADKSLIR